MKKAYLILFVVAMVVFSSVAWAEKVYLKINSNNLQVTETNVSIKTKTQINEEIAEQQQIKAELVAQRNAINLQIEQCNTNIADLQAQKLLLV